MRRERRTGRRAARLLCVLLMAAALTGCGRRLVMTRGFRNNQVFRVGNQVCTTDALRVYFLDLEKQCCRMFGDAVLDEGQNDGLRESLRQKGISEASRVLALKQLAIRDNIMLTDQEEELCEKAGSEFYDSLSKDEKSYIGMSRAGLQDMYMDYALADKTYRSIGDNFASRYDLFIGTLDSDLNRGLWDTIDVKKVSGDDSALSFSEVYAKYFSE